MPGTDSPEEHVLAFIESYYRAWQQASGGLADGLMDFEIRMERLRSCAEHWEALISPIEEAFFMPNQPRTLGGSFGNLPEHEPEREVILQSRLEGNVAVVETQDVGGRLSGAPFRVYELRHVHGEWRIDRLQSYDEEVGATAFTEAEIQETLSQIRPDAPLPELPRGEEPNCHHLFEAGRTVTVFGQPQIIEVHRRGPIRLTSGCLGACDLGYSIEDFVPLERSIPKGDFIAEFAEAGGQMLACRILFAPDIPAVRYHPARKLDGSDLVGMDAANVTFVDAASYMALPSQERERLFFETVMGTPRYRTPEEVEELAAGRPELREIFAQETIYEGAEWDLHLATSPDEPPDAMYFTTCSDGGFPLYWGIGAKGELVSVTLDTLTAAEWKREIIRVPWSRAELGKQVRHPLLEDWDVQVTLKKERGLNGIHLLGNGEAFTRARLLDRDAQCLADTDTGAMNRTGDETVYVIRPDLARLEEATLEIQLTVGYTN